MGSTTFPLLSPLFSPLQLGTIPLNHRIAMAPLTRMRASSSRIPTSLMKEYYSQRASIPGTILITEGTFISPSAAGGFPHAPGIWNDEQVAAWKDITDAIHAKGCFVFCQLFAMGRAADRATAEAEGWEIVAPSAIPISDREEGDVPREMTREEIKQTIKYFEVATMNAMRAGFDGVECHIGNGYLLDQFVQDVSNQRRDEYGGSCKNRSRIVVEVLERMVDAVGGQAEKVGLRISPWSRFQDMRMDDPVRQFSDLLKRVAGKWSNMAYLHMVESRITGSNDVEGTAHLHEKLQFAYEIWPKTSAILVAGAFTLDSARRLVEEEHPDRKVVVVFGRWFISNPDLVYRLQHGLELTRYHRDTFYACETSKGYVDYPFSEEYLSQAKA